MIITQNILDEKVPKDLIPTRLDSALNLYTNVTYGDKSGIIVYNTNPDTWNCLYSFYETDHKFTIDNYIFGNTDITYRQLIAEYQQAYTQIYEIDEGYTKEKRKVILIDAFKKTFGLQNANITAELDPIFELKFSKSKNVWTLYYFENYVATKIDGLYALLSQTLYEQKILPLDPDITEIDGLAIGSNIPYLLSITKNIKKLNQNLVTV